MVSRKAIALFALVVLLTPGCGRTTLSTPGTRPVSPSEDASAALSGAWIPADPPGRGLDSLRVSTDGSMWLSLTTTSTIDGTSVSATFKGSWRRVGPHTVLFSAQGGVLTATYDYRRVGDSLSLQWVSGAGPRSALYGPTHYQSLESDSWITGTSGSVRFAPQR